MKSILLPALLWWLLYAAHYPAPLPAEITSFTGKCSEGHIRLEWTTRTETNTQAFRIEASADEAGADEADADEADADEAETADEADAPAPAASAD